MVDDIGVVVTDAPETEMSLAIVELGVWDVISVEAIEVELSKGVFTSSVVLENVSEVVLRVLA